jgi:hypothetical protein
VKKKFKKKVKYVWRVKPPFVILYQNLKQHLKKQVMSTLKFNDGEEFDLSGELRTEERKDGWYVLGDNKLIPVSDEEDGLLTIEKLNTLK